MYQSPASNNAAEVDDDEVDDFMIDGSISSAGPSTPRVNPVHIGVKPSPIPKSPICNSKLLLLYLYVKATIGLAGVVLFWTGSWNYIDQHLNRTLGFRHEQGEDVDAYDNDPNYALKKEVILFFLGIALIALTGSFFVHATLNVDAEFEWRFPCCPTPVNGLLVRLQTTIGLFGSVIYWVGGYNISDLYLFPDDVGYNWVAVLAGLLLLEASNAFRQYAAIYVDGDPIDFCACSRGRQVFIIVRALMSLWGGIIVWRGAYNLLTYEFWVEDTLTRDSLMCICGYIMFMATSTLSANAGVDPDDILTEETVLIPPSNQSSTDFAYVPAPQPTAQESAPPEPEPEPPFAHRPWLFRLRHNLQAGFAMMAGFLFWTGAWNLLSDYYYQNSLAREMIYMWGGFLLMVLTGTLTAQAGISPSSTMSTLRGSKPKLTLKQRLKNLDLVSPDIV